MSMIESLVVVHYPQGWVASLRFDNNKDDIDISGNSRWFIFERIDQLVNEGGLRRTGGAHPLRSYGAHLRPQRRPREGQGFAHLNEQGSATLTARVNAT